MKRFSELGIKAPEDKNIFDVPKISISGVINCEIEVLDFHSGVKTDYGDDRFVVKIRYNDKEYKFFTSAGSIKEVLMQIPKEDFPFIATIKQKGFGTGNNRSYYFT